MRKVSKEKYDDFVRMDGRSTYEARNGDTLTIVSLNFNGQEIAKARYKSGIQQPEFYITSDN